MGTRNSRIKTIHEYNAFIEGVEEAISLEEKRRIEGMSPGPFSNMLNSSFMQFSNMKIATMLMCDISECIEFFQILVLKSNE